MLRTHFIDLLEKPMDRKDFLKQLGIGALMLSGASAVVTSLLNRGEHTRINGSSDAMTYGAASYGSAPTKS